MPLQRLAFLLGLTVAGIHPALSHPPGMEHDDSPESHWFTEQHNVKGGWCCNLADAFYLGDDEWAETKDGYKVKIGGEWHDVPEGALRDPKGGKNPTGNAIVWYGGGTGGEEIVIWCFAPGFTY